MEKFSPAELLNQSKQKIEKKRSKKSGKYITKVVNGEKIMILNPDYTFKHTN